MSSGSSPIAWADGGSVARDVRGDRFVGWVGEQLGGVDVLRVKPLDASGTGHSADMVALRAAWRDRGAEHECELVVRIRPPAPGLLEPYDLQRQFDMLRALEDTAVPAPRALWIEPTGAVLGRAFFVMEHVDGDVYEMSVPDDLDPARIRRMTENLVDQLAAIHLVDLEATGLGSLGGGDNYVDRELDRWERDLRRVQRGPLPALERLLTEVRRRRPAPSPHVTLVHGDAKPGNFAFVGDTVSAVFDWELADVGDPLADVGYLEAMWAMPVGLPSRPGALSVDEVVARYEDRTGIAVVDRAWYRAFQSFKLGVIMLLGSMLVDAGHSDDLRLAGMAHGVPMVTRAGLRDLGVEEDLPDGPVAPRAERMEELHGLRRG